MPNKVSVALTKQTIKERLSDKDLQCHYYEAIMNTTTDMIALTDGDRIIDANMAMLNGCEALGKDILSPTFTFKKFFEVINKFDYIYDGYQEKRWYESVLLGEKSDYRVGIAHDGNVHTYNLTLTLLKPFDQIYVMTLADVTSLMGYKAALEEGIKSSMKDREKSQYLLRQYDKAMESSTLVYKCDTRGIITHANKALSEVFLYGYGELSGKHISVLRGPTISDEEDNAVWDKLMRGKTHRGTMENIDKMGGIHYFDVYIVPIVDQEGNIVEFLSLRHEITEVMQSFGRKE